MRQTNTEIAQQVQIEAPVKNTPPRKMILVGVLLLIVLGSIVSGLEYRTYAASYQRDQVLAQEGMQHLIKVTELLNAAARNPLDASIVAKMQYEFAAAVRLLTQVHNDLK